MPGDERPAERRPRIQPDAETRRRPVRRDSAVVGDEIILGVFGGNPALNGVTQQADIVLCGNAGRKITDAAALRDANLALDEIDSRDPVGHRMLDLNPRIHFDEIGFTRIGILEELDRAGIHVADGTRELQGFFAKRQAGIVIEIGCRRAFDDFLVAPLNRAIPFPEMDDVAVGVAHNLDFHVTGVSNQLFQIDLAIAECRLRLTAGGPDAVQDIGLVVDHAHAAPAAAPGRLDHHRVADVVRLALDIAGIVKGQGIGCGHDRDAGLFGQRAGGNLGAQLPHRVARGTDKINPRGAARVGKIGIFGQKSVTGVNGVDPGLQGNPDYVFSVQIGLDRTLAGADQIALVRLVAVQGKPVFGGVDGDCRNAQLGGGTHHADRDFRAVCNQQFLDFACPGRHVGTTPPWLSSGHLLARTTPASH